MKKIFLALTLLSLTILGYTQKPVLAPNGVKFGSTVISAAEGATLDGNTENIATRFADTPRLSNATEISTITKMMIPISDGVQHTHTGNTSATVVYSDTIHSGEVDAYGRIEVDALWTANNSVGTKTCTVYMRNVGGADTSIGSVILSGTSIAGQTLSIIRMRNSLSSQVSYNPGVAAQYGSTTVAIKTYTINFANPVIISFSITLQTGTDNASLEGCLVKTFRGQ